MSKVSFYKLAVILLLALGATGCRIKDRNGTPLCCQGFSEDSNGQCVSNCQGQFDKSPKIVVIGAGASGIAAATRLLWHGFQNVTVLEAQNRIGGRINSVPFGDDFIDLGAQWCHGEKNNVVYEMVKDKNLLDNSQNTYENFFIRSDSKIVPTEVSKKLLEIVENASEEEEVLLKTYNDSLGAYYKDYFFNELTKDKYASIDRVVAEEFFEAFQKGLASFEGAKSTYDVSAKGNLHYVTCEGNQELNWKGKGYVTILKFLMESNCSDFGILNKRIFLNQEVANVKWDHSGAQTEVKCLSGIEHEADHVIFTGSVGVLRAQIKTLFKPELPENKYRAAKGIGFETVNKIFIYFSEKWWADDFQGFTLQWKEKDLQELRNTEYAWLEGLFGFFTVDFQPNVLLGWVVGDSALHLETLPRSKQMEGTMYILRRFLKNSTIPQPIDFIASGWSSNQFVRGSYSYRSLDTEDLDTGAADLAEPILADDNKPVLLFAGEATHSYYYSTVHGAIESGWREADRIYGYYCKSD